MARARGLDELDDERVDAIGRLVVRAVADAGQRDHALDGRVARERVDARRRRPRVLLAVHDRHGRAAQARVLQELLRERARRVRERVEDDVGRAGREQRREQHVDELVRDGRRVEVRLGEDLLDGRLGRERVEERLAARAQRRLDRAHGGLDEAGRLGRVQLAEVRVDDEHAVEARGRVARGLQRGDGADRVAHARRGAARGADDLRDEVGELLGPPCERERESEREPRASARHPRPSSSSRAAPTSHV